MNLENIYLDDEIKIILEGKKVIITPSEANKEISEDLFTKISSISTLCSALLFETLNAQGTNIIIEDSSVFSSHIIPRFENDELSFLWNSQNFNEAEITKIKEKIEDALFKQNHTKKDSSKSIVEKETIKEKVIEVESEEGSEEINNSEKEINSEDNEVLNKDNKEKPKINYIIKQFQRRP